MGRKARITAALLLVLAISVSLMPFYGMQQVYAENEEYAGNGYAELLDPLTIEDGEQLLPVTIDLESGTVRIDGSEDEESFEDVYDYTAPKRRSLANSVELDKEKVLDFLLEKPCAVYEKDDGTLRAEYPFSLKLLFVLVGEGELEGTYGAVNALYDSENSRYVLQYDSQESTAYAYSQLATAYGKQNVIIDLPAVPSADAESYDATYSQDLFRRTTADSISWGTDAMYMDYLRDWIEANPPKLPSDAPYCMVAVIDTGIRVDETNETIIDGLMQAGCRNPGAWRFQAASLDTLTPPAVTIQSPIGNRRHASMQICQDMAHMS